MRGLATAQLLTILLYFVWRYYAGFSDNVDNNDDLQQSDEGEHSKDSNDSRQRASNEEQLTGRSSVLSR